MTDKTKYPIEFLNAIKELKDAGIIEEVRGEDAGTLKAKKTLIRLTKKGWKTKAKETQ